MKLHQLKVDYEAEQDRLLMLIATSEGAELRMWLTRRFVKLLWPLLVGLAEQANPRLGARLGADARKALLDIEHQEAVSKADFSKAYERKERSTPLGEAPLLLGRMRTGHDRKGRPLLALHPAQGQGVTLTLDAVLLHSLCRLLQAAVKKSGWDIELALPGTQPAPAEERAARRTLN